MSPLTNWGRREEASGKKGVPYPACQVWDRKCTWELGRDRTRQVCLLSFLEQRLGHGKEGRKPSGAAQGGPSSRE